MEPSTAYQPTLTRRDSLLLELSEAEMPSFDRLTSDGSVRSDKRRGSVTKFSAKGGSSTIQTYSDPDDEESVASINANSIFGSFFNKKTFRWGFAGEDYEVEEETTKVMLKKGPIQWFQGNRIIVGRAAPVHAFIVKYDDYLKNIFNKKSINKNRNKFKDSSFQNTSSSSKISSATSKRVEQNIFGQLHR